MTDYEKLYERDPKVYGDPSGEFIQFFNRYSGPPLSVLDLGCGQGRDALMIARKGHSVFGVDISSTGVAQMKEAARSEDLSVDGVACDLRSFRPNARFGAAVLDRVLHMLAEAKDRTLVLGKSADCLLDRGHLLIADVPKDKRQIEAFFKSHPHEWQAILSNKNFTFVQRK